MPMAIFMQGLPLSAIFNTENCIVSHRLMSKSPEREKYAKVTEEYVEGNNYAKSYSRSLSVL